MAQAGGFSSSATGAGLTVSVPQIRKTSDENVTVTVGYEQFQCTKPFQSKRIWFNIQDPIDPFLDRPAFMTRLHQDIQEGDRLKIIVGAGGVGKTEVVRGYINSYRIFYENVIWINARSRNSMESSFCKLARKLKIHVTDRDSGRDREMAEIVRDCYQQVCAKVTLIVFDHAQTLTDDKSTKFAQEAGVKSFLPSDSLSSDLLTPFVIVTSRNEDWTALTNQIVSLNSFQEPEFVPFLLSQFQLTNDPPNREEVAALGTLLNGLPLSLQMALAYIREENEDRKLAANPVPFKAADYAQKFRETTQNLFHPKKDVVMVQWQMAANKIELVEHGEFALKMAHIMATLRADGVPVKFFFTLVQEEDKAKFQKCLLLLTSYALVKFFDEDEGLQMDRVVQESILENLNVAGKLEGVLTGVLAPCRKTLNLLALRFRRCSDALRNILSVIETFALIPLNETFANFVYDVAVRYRQSGKYYQASCLLYIVYVFQKTHLSPHAPSLLKTQQSMALLLFNMERYEEALDMYLQVHETEDKILRPDDPDLLMTQQSLAGVLVKLGRKGLAIEFLTEVYHKTSKRLGADHPQTLRAQKFIGDLEDESEIDFDLEI